jgi:ABC-type Fe3+ transport system permease subunit
MSPLAPGATARCPDHPDREARDVCVRCGRFVCGTCLELGEEQETLCTACYARTTTRGKASGQAVGALVLALVGLNCMMPFLGIVSVVLGNSEVRAIERGESPSAGRNLAKGAIVLGWIEIGLMVVGLIALGIFLLTYKHW